MEGPYLIAPSEKYWSAKTKVAFVGQETRGWACSECDIEQQMKAYSDFNLGEKYRASPFYSVIRQFELALTGGHYTSVTLNLNRYDQGGKRPT
jgi:hypothetical protein